MSEKPTGTLRFSLDAQSPHTLTPAQRKALRRRTDDEIDYSDLPSQNQVQWTRPGALVPTENKQQLTLRLDADVVAFFKSTGRRYQSRINAALREYMSAHKKAV